MGSTERKSGLREGWGTNPDCSACRLTSPDFALHERKHLIINEANWKPQSIPSKNPFLYEKADLCINYIFVLSSHK